MAVVPDGDANDAAAINDLAAVTVNFDAQLTSVDLASLPPPPSPPPPPPPPSPLQPGSTVVPYTIVNASGSVPTHVPLSPTLYFSFAVLIHESRNLTAAEAKEVEVDRSELPSSNVTATVPNGDFVSNASSIPDATVRDAPTAHGAEGAGGNPPVELPIGKCAASGLAEPTADAWTACELPSGFNVSSSFSATLDLTGLGLTSGDRFEIIVRAHSAAAGRKPAERHSQVVVVDLALPIGVVNDAPQVCNVTTGSCADSRGDDIDVVGVSAEMHAWWAVPRRAHGDRVVPGLPGSEPFAGRPRSDDCSATDNEAHLRPRRRRHPQPEVLRVGSGDRRVGSSQLVPLPTAQRSMRRHQ